jgi:hypothetical protein
LEVLDIRAYPVTISDDWERNLMEDFFGPGRSASPPSAAALATSLRAGWFPPPMQVPFPLQADESCVGIVDAAGEQWLEGEGSYTHKSVAWAGGLSGLVLGGTLNAVGNARRRAKAARQAAEQWRHIDSFRIYVTTSRIALQGSRDWHDMWFSNLRTLNYDDAGVILQMSGNPASRLRMWPPDYWFVMLRKLAFNDIYDVNAPR